MFQRQTSCSLSKTKPKCIAWPSYQTTTRPRQTTERLAANLLWEIANVAYLCNLLATVTLACYCNIKSETYEIERAVHNLHGVDSSMAYTTWKVSPFHSDCHSHCDKKNIEKIIRTKLQSGKHSRSQPKLRQHVDTSQPSCSTFRSDVLLRQVAGSGKGLC